jgi:serine/threonine protein kinase
MPLVPGTKLGPYEISTALGAGGMGEVYRARDTRLSRDVAIKVLPLHLSSNPDLKARFEREARSISSLSDPHICTLYDVGHQDDIDFLVMELLDGETLADRLQRGALPLKQALQCGIDIAQALEKAHRNGIVHRDLKPGNIMLTKAGAKLLDFGLAKPAKSIAATVSGSAATMAAPLTGEATIVGTFQYMSPEQIHGESADARTDIFALGAVLFEIVTGKRAFQGKSQISIMSAILEEEPEPISALQPLAPPGLDRVIKACLAKDPEERIQTAHDVKLQLEWIRDAAPQAGLPAPPAARRRIRRRMSWAVAGILMATLGFFAGMYFRPWKGPGLPIVSQISPPERASFSFQGVSAGPPVLSPNGQRLAFVAVDSDGKQRLWVRQLNAAKAQPLEGSDDSAFPFWSADSRYIGFFANKKLSRIDASGGPVFTTADVAASWGGTWSRDDTILFASADCIYRIPASGGTPQQVTKLDASRGEDSHLWPQFLPDGRHFLFYAQSKDPQNSGTYAATLDGGEPKLLMRGDSNAVYSPPGYLLFVRQGTLMAQRFDPDNLRLTGEAVPLAQHAAANLTLGRSNLTASENGILTYAAGNASAGDNRISWFGRNGKPMADTGEPGAYFSPRISPDGRKLAIALGIPGTSNYNIWVFDLVRGVPTRITFSSSLDGQPAWSPDGKTVVFTSNRSGQFHIYQTTADGTGDASPIVADDAGEYNPSFSADGRYLVYRRLSAQSGAHYEIWAIPLYGDRKPFPVVSQTDAAHPALSPDGKWLAYSSQESGRPETYVVPFPQGNAKWRVSTDGGDWPRWRHDGKELFFLSRDQKITSAGISTDGTSLVVGKLAPLFQVNVPISLGWFYDVSADGNRFVVLNQAPRQTTEPLTLVVNWPVLLKKQ